MTRATPPQLRAALQAARAYADAGLLFVCLPILDDADYVHQIEQADARLARLIDIAEAEEAKG